MIFEKGNKILMVGDSITEDGRFYDPKGIGSGYVGVINEYLNDHCASLDLKLVNKGISGNRITDLADRWETDVIAEDPDWVSISVGVNDVLRQFDSPEMKQVSPEEFELMYEALLNDVTRRTKARLILMEPTPIDEALHPEANAILKPYVESVKRLVEKFDTIFVPMNHVFTEVLSETPDTSLTTDGVHMNESGKKLMAETWLSSTGVSAN